MFTRHRRRIAWMLEHWGPYRKELRLVVAVTFANAGAIMIYPVLLERIVDGIREGVSWTRLAAYAGGLLLGGGLHAAIYYTLQYSRMRVNVSLDYGIRMRAFEHLLRMGPAFFQRFRTGDLVTRLTDDVSEKLSWFLCSGIFRALEAATVILFGVAMMLRMDPGLTLRAAGPLPLLVAVYVLLAGRLNARYQAVQRSISRVNDALESAMSGIRVTKGFAVEPMQFALVSGAIEEQRKAEVRAVRYQTVMDSLYGHIWQLSIVVVLLAGGARVIGGRLTLGQLVAFDAYVMLLVMPMMDLGQFLVRGRVSSVSISRLTELEAVEPEVPEASFAPLRPRRPQAGGDGALAAIAAAAPVKTAVKLAVRFESVGFRYRPDTRPALAGFSLSAEPGTMIALAGPVASGKSTALKLALRLMDPTEGRIHIAGRPLAGWNLDELRGATGYVPQEASLFSTTVRENILLGRAAVTEEDLAMAVRAAGLEAEIADWPDGLETRVGARGVRLSGGQKQRVALARALAGRPALVLLDDCTSNLDAETEERVWPAIGRELPGATVILVTHRPATLRRADRILLLDGGRVVAGGTFGELDESSAAFRGMYARWDLEARVREQAE